ncbi:class I SAM-dependent methyltransferase [Streptomonospora wellingtoniae]|uniref:Class I SAM-dependent methyltransferase n=1 Tax=Streptomonospora wellingtoniae TaxID=3075544 RepID=A0ABU2L0V8_9ACTN|nr:class I SAM-dependent methyltransferase [Streptomonospora sp. DSM 45055]MDT0305191.1 class I SAM-dependent methyltransferase [Streptomonospora sp. DSM 45055]
MPTISSEPTPPEPREPHRARGIAESFGTDPERYDRARPRYPDAMVRAITAACPGPDVLDAGCGTGVSARAFQKAGCRVLGVEPDARMAGWARRHGTEAEIAKFESWDPADRSFDAVVSGQAWHWVDPDAGAAKAAGILRPGGRLAVFWNAARPPLALAEAFDDVYRRILPDFLARAQWTPTGADPYGAVCDRAAGGIRDCASFGEPEQWRFDWERTYTREEWLDQVPTTGGHTRLAPEELERVLEGVGAAVDDFGGAFTMPYTALVVTASRTGAG